MTATVAHLAGATPRRAVRDQEETQDGYLTRVAGHAGPASAKTITRALVHYSAESAGLTRLAGMPLTGADGRGAAPAAEIYWAGWADCAAAMTAPLEPHLRVVTLDDVTAASLTAIEEAAG